MVDKSEEDRGYYEARGDFVALDVGAVLCWVEFGHDYGWDTDVEGVEEEFDDTCGCKAGRGANVGVSGVNPIEKLGSEGRAYRRCGSRAIQPRGHPSSPAGLGKKHRPLR